MKDYILRTDAYNTKINENKARHICIYIFDELMKAILM